MSAMAYQISGVSILCLTVYWSTYQRSASLAFLMGIPSQRTSNAENVSIRIYRHTAHTIVPWPNPKQWVIVHISDLMIIRQNIYSLNHHKQTNTICKRKHFRLFELIINCTTILKTKSRYSRNVFATSDRVWCNKYLRHKTTEKYNNG